MFEGVINQISALLHSYVGKTLQNQTMTWTKMMDSMLPQLSGCGFFQTAAIPGVPAS